MLEQYNNLKSMQPQNQQQDMTPEEAFASLGLATRLNEQMLMSQNTPKGQPTDPSQIPQDVPEQAQPIENIKTLMDDLEARLSAKIDNVKKEVSKDDTSSEIQSLKEELNKILTEEDDE